jgi:hypothetical protein
MKDKNQIILPINAGKIIWLNSTSLHNKALNKLGIEQSYLNVKVCMTTHNQYYTEWQKIGGTSSKIGNTTKESTLITFI